MSTTGHDVLTSIADAYVAFLACMPWDRPLVVAGAREGLTKFLSNAYIASFPRRRKHEITQLISEAARVQLDQGHRSGPVFEHVVPKGVHIQSHCERLAQQGTLSSEQVVAVLRRYWVLAMITEEENRRLRRGMPRDWDGLDVFARYKAAGITLIANPFAADDVPKL